LAAGVLADSATGAFGGVNGDEFSLRELWWHFCNQIDLGYLNISLKIKGF
jgi:hypothetical protein